MSAWFEAGDGTSMEHFTNEGLPLTTLLTSALLATIIWLSDSFNCISFHMNIIL